MQSFQRPALLCIAAAATLSVLGCGASGPATHAVTGTVTYQGSPVEGATVGFSPAAGEVRSAVGVTDSQGKYQLTTFEQDDGAMEGTYRVRVFKYDRDPVQVEMDLDGVGQSDEMPDDYVPEAATEVAAPTNLLPQKFSNPATTPLEFTVEKGDNTFDIDLDE